MCIVEIHEMKQGQIQSTRRPTTWDKTCWDTLQKQTKVVSLSSVGHCNFSYPRFLEISNFSRTTFRFPLRFEKFGFNCNFGMIIRSLDVRIGSVFVFTAIWVRFYNTCFRALCNFFSGNKVTAPPSPKVPVRLWTRSEPINGSWAAQPVNQKLEYSALIGLFTQACRTPAKFEFSPNEKEVLRHSMAFSLESSLSFLTLLFRRNLTLPFFQVLLFPISLHLHWIWNSLRNNSVLFNLHFVCTIITLINLNNFKYPTKIRLCS